MYRFLVDSEGAEPGELFSRISTLLPNQMEVHVPPVNLTVARASQQELVNRINSYGVNMLHIPRASSEVG